MPFAAATRNSAKNGANNLARTQADRADQSRARILEAAIAEFSENGLAGARTEQIAETAGVNKALLYYYFEGKEALYAAAIESVADRAVESSMAALSGKRSAGERLCQFVLNHFDRIHSQRSFQNLMQQEMMRLRRGEENALAPLVERAFRPITGAVQELLAEGMHTGELIRVDVWQMMYAALGANVFYFLSGPTMGLLFGKDPFVPKALMERRKAAILYLGQTVFTDRRHGGRVAERVIARTPMPESAPLLNRYKVRTK
jgi:TetR/AcrR family transcriptional regulator